MDFRWFGALHLIAAVVWISGLLLLAIVAGVYAGQSPDKAREQPLLAYVRQWNRNVTSPAMILLWIFGIILIVHSGGVFQPWLGIKLAVLILLSALHGKLSKTVRQLAGAGITTSGAFTRHGKVITLLSVVVIILLAKFKPLLF